MSRSVLQGLHLYGYKGRVAVTSHTTPNAEQLKQAGADRVLIPYADAAAEAVDSLFDESGTQPPPRVGDRNNTEGMT